MNATAIAAPIPTTTTTTTDVDSRSAYVGFASAYVFGHGAAALAPTLDLPGWLPLALLGAGMVAGTVHSVNAVNRAMRGASKSEQFAGRLLGASWIIAFAGLFLAITGLTSAFDMPELQAVLWPAGSTLMVGLIYLAEGAMRRNTLHYGLGTWLIMVATTALFLSGPGFFLLLAVAGGGGYVVAAVLERRRQAAGNTAS